MSWSISLPLTSTEANQTVTIYQDNWSTIQSYIGIEHSNFAYATSGTHLAGIAGVLAEGSTSTITGLSTTPGSGSLAFDTTKGCWLINGAGDDDKWVSIHRALGTTRVVANLSGDIVTTPGAGWTTTVIPFQTEVIDSLGEFSSPTFCAKDEGYFLVSGQVLHSTDTASGGDIIGLVLYGSYGTYRSLSRTTVSSAYETYSLSTIAYVPSAGTLALYFVTPPGKTTTISSGAGNTFIRIHRVS